MARDCKDSTRGNRYTASGPSLDSRESAQLVEIGARRKTREEIGPLPTPPALFGSSFPLSLGYFARLRDYREREGLLSKESPKRLGIFLARHVLLPALACAHSRAPLPRPLSHQNISRQCVEKRYLIWRHCSSIYTTSSGLWFSFPWELAPYLLRILQLRLFKMLTTILEYINSQRIFQSLKYSFHGDGNIWKIIQPNQKQLTMNAK